MCWWVDLGYPAFEEGKGGFPRTGQVIKHYREMKRDDAGKAWTQIRLARDLKISGKAAGDIENKDVGLDFDRRRYLCKLFDIPPLLLGIRTREEILKLVEVEKTKKEASIVSSANPPSTLWWAELGYPEFAPGDDGFPLMGQVVKHYRRQKMDKKGKPWTQRLLALSLGITEQAVRDMESRGSGMDFDRRQFLSEWLDIPPILLGITTVGELLKRVEEQKGEKQTAEPTTRPVVSTAARTSRKLVIDVQEYTTLITGYWTAFIGGPTPVSMQNVYLDIDALYRELPHIKGQRPIYELLCRYHDFVANVLRDQQQYNEAIEHCNKALRFAKQLNSNELKVLVLYDIGYILWHVGRFEEALQKYEEARRYEQGLPNNLKGVLLVETGLTEAIIAKTPEKGKEAIALVDHVGNMVRSDTIEDDPYFLTFNLDFYHLRRSLSLMALGQNRDAINELRLVKAGAEYPRRQAKTDIYQAQAHMNLGEYERVVELAESGLEVAQRIDSQVLVARVEKIYQKLKESPYKGSPDVGRLDYLFRRRKSKR